MKETSEGGGGVGGGELDTANQLSIHHVREREKSGRCDRIAWNIFVFISLSFLNLIV